MTKSWNQVSETGYYGFRFSENGKRIYFSGHNKLMSIQAATLIQ